MLFVCGAQDGATPPAVIREMTGLVAGDAIELVDPGAHICNIENPEGCDTISTSGCRAERAERLFLERSPASKRSRTSGEILVTLLERYGLGNGLFLPAGALASPGWGKSRLSPKRMKGK